MEEKQPQFEQLLLPHLDAAYNLARWIVKRDQDAQDIVQEAYLRATKGIGGFRGTDARAWLLTIVRNTAYSWMKEHPNDSNMILTDAPIPDAPTDEQFVQSLADELKTEKIEPWLCEVDVELGHNFGAKIEEGLREADLALLFWSPEAARSDWTRLEWTSVTAREISESRTRLGVALLRECALPQLLRLLKASGLQP